MPKLLPRHASGVIICGSTQFIQSRQGQRLTAFSTPGGGGYGQNIAAGIQAGNISAILSNNFYNDELPRYPEFGTSSPDLTLFEEWGHFSQLVWKATLSVGCYTEICSPPGADPLDCKSDDTSYLNGLACGNGGIPAIFTVCNYDPPGGMKLLYIKPLRSVERLT